MKSMKFTKARRLSAALRLAWPALLPSLLAPLPLGAQESEPAEDPVQLEAVTVKASPFARSRDDLVQAAEVLAGKELDRKRKATIGETLENELGVSTTDFGPGVGRPVIRGQGGARVQVLENGIASMDVSTLSSDHAVTIDPANAQQIEILKGPATLMFGNGASAGVVNVINNRLPTQYIEGNSGSAEVSVGSNANERQLAVDLNHGAGGYLLHFDGAQRRTGDFDIPGFADPANPVSEGRLANSALDSRSGALSLSRIGEDGSAGLAVSAYDHSYGLPQEPDAFIAMRQTRVDAQATRNRPSSFLSSLSLRLGANDYTHTEFEDAATPGTKFDNREADLRVEARHLPLAGFTGVFGLQGVDRDFSAVGDEAFVQPVQTRSLGLFLIEEHPFSWGRIEFGLRADRVANDPASLRTDGTPNIDPRSGLQLQARNHTPLSYSFGSVYNFSEHLHLRAGYAHAQRAPSAEELYAFGPHLATGTFERGNAAFDKENSDNFDLTLDRDGARWSWKLSLYYNRIADYLYLQELDANLDADNTATGPDANGVPDGEADRVDETGVFVAPANLAGDELILVDYRQSDARFYGIEGETGYRLLDSEALKLNGRLFGDLVRGELSGGGNLPRITPTRYGIGLDGSLERWNAELTLTRIARQTRISSLETATAGYTLLSADLGYSLSRGAVSSYVFLRGRNLLDEDARRHTSFLKDVVPQAGRSFIVGLRADF